MWLALISHPLHISHKFHFARGVDPVRRSTPVVTSFTGRFVAIRILAEITHALIVEATLSSFFYLQQGQYLHIRHSHELDSHRSWILCRSISDRRSCGTIPRVPHASRIYCQGLLHSTARHEHMKSCPSCSPPSFQLIHVPTLGTQYTRLAPQSP